MPIGGLGRTGLAGRGLLSSGVGGPDRRGLRKQLVAMVTARLVRDETTRMTTVGPDAGLKEETLLPLNQGGSIRHAHPTRLVGPRADSPAEDGLRDVGSRQ